MYGNCFRGRNEEGMSQQYFIFFGLANAFIVALCISVFIVVNRVNYEIYELKKEFRRFRDGEQYQCYIENPFTKGEK